MRLAIHRPVHSTPTNKRTSVDGAGVFGTPAVPVTVRKIFSGKLKVVLEAGGYPATVVGTPAPRDVTDVPVVVLTFAPDDPCGEDDIGLVLVGTSVR